MSKTLAEKSSARTIFLFGAAVVVIILAVFYAPFWNRSIGYKGGPPIFTAYAWMLLHGYIPYKDYYCPAPLFHTFWSAAIMALFGNHFVVLRLISVLERLSAGLILYLLFARLFSLRTAALVSIFTLIVSSMDPADGMDVYTQQSILFTLFAVLIASFSLDEGRTLKKLCFLGFLGGAFTCLSFFTKQSVGAGFTVVYPLATFLCLYKLRGRSVASTYLLSYVLGWFFIAALFFLWMFNHGAAFAFIQQAFIEGPKAKSLSTMFFRLLNENATFWYATLTAAIALLLSCIKVIRSEYVESPSGTRFRDLAYVLLIGLLALGAAHLMLMHPADECEGLTPVTFVTVFHVVARKSLMFFTLYGLIFYCIRCLNRMIRTDEFSWRIAQYSLIAALSFSDAATACLSFPFYEAMLIPGPSLFIAAVAEDLRGWKLKVFYVIWGFYISGAMLSKLNMPYSWESFREASVLDANSKSKLPQLSGYLLSDEMIRFLDTTTALVHKYSKPGETIFSYPDGALIYPLTDRPPATFSLSLNMDTTSDELLAKDAQRLLDSPPKVIVYRKIPEAELNGFEKFWRAGKPSGNRKIADSIEKLSSRYLHVGKFKVGSTRTYEFDVYAEPPSEKEQQNR